MPAEFGRLQGQITDPIYVIDMSGSSFASSGSVSTPIYVVFTVPPSGSPTNPTNRLSLLESALHAMSGAVTGSREIYTIYATNNSSSTLYFQTFDTGSLPVNGATPRRVYPVPQLSVFSADFSTDGARLYSTNGFSFAWSLVPEVLATGSASLFRNLSVDVSYR